MDAPGRINLLRRARGEAQVVQVARATTQRVQTIGAALHATTRHVTRCKPNAHQTSLAR